MSPIWAKADSGSILQLCASIRTRTVDAAENLRLFFDPVTDDSAIAVRTGRRERMNRALKAVEHMLFAVG